MNTSHTETNINDSRYALGLAASSLHMAQYLHDVEANEERKKMMSRIISKKRDAFKLAIDSCNKAKLGLDPSATHAGAVTSWIRQWKLDDRLTLLIDTLFADPFLPYEVKYSEKNFKIAWQKLGIAVGVGSISQQKIEDAAADAKKAHHHINWLKIGLCGAAAAGLLASGAWVVAPMAGAALGGAAGLSGAAAVSYGLALLGGGSLAAGGAGMAGGMWLVTTTAAAIGGAVGVGSQVAYQLGAQQFQVEVIKLQVNLKTLVAENQLSLAAAQGKISNLREQRQELEKHLNDERELNDSNSQRLKDLEAKILAVTDAIGWLEKEAA